LSAPIAVAGSNVATTVRIGRVVVRMLPPWAPTTLSSFQS
jgi:hypothetical protein